MGAAEAPAQRVVAVTQAANSRSRALLERLGLVATDRFVEHGAELGERAAQRV